MHQALQPAIDAHSDCRVVIKLWQRPTIRAAVLAEQLAAGAAVVSADEHVKLEAARTAILHGLVVGPLLHGNKSERLTCVKALPAEELPRFPR